ncbi:PREDICTED: uncharacterized protein C11orf94 homolog [Tinamus guttatus]|uniref:uncharacterized protein C11orf94 homolog n=1 Tax=Tinamus guttatus TaxID=94827 RepID=UPI00052E9B67|nr:PREDICTED: uncharacterized protein C11orf94 homolog [Tinamus guttatus]
MRHWLLLLAALVGAVLPLPLHKRVDYSVHDDLQAPLRLPRPHFGLVDDYGIRPKQPHFRSQATQAQPAWLRRAGKSKRDQLDLSEYYYDNRL